MRKSLLKRIAVVAMSLALTFSMQAPVMALGDVSVTAKAATENVGEYTISLTKKGAKKSLTLGINKSLNLIVMEKNAVVTKNLKFASTKKDVATVSNKGLITTKKIGTTKINITNTKTKSKATLTIKVDYVDVSSLALSSKEITLNVGQTANLTATVAPAYSAVPKWTSFFPEVADVNNGVVTAKAAGTGIIVVNAGSKMEFCRVNVGGAKVPVASIKMEPYCSLTGSFKDGDTQQFSVEVSPSNATNKAVTWTTSDDSVADVDPKTGLVTFNGVGSTIITATATDGSNAYDSCLVTVTDFTTTIMKKTKIGKSDTYAEITRNGADVTLSITGTGDMPDYPAPNEVSSRAPWYDFRSQITKVEVGSGVTGVGVYEFYACSNLTEAFVSNTVTHINDHAFSECANLKEFTVEKGGTISDLAISNDVFENCKNLQFLRLPKLTNYVSFANNALKNSSTKQCVLIEKGAKILTNNNDSMVLFDGLY